MLSAPDAFTPGAQLQAGVGERGGVQGPAGCPSGAAWRAGRGRLGEKRCPAGVTWPFTHG